MVTDFLPLLMSVPLFGGIAPATAETLLAKGDFVSCKAEEEIPCEQNGLPCLAVLLTGQARVLSSGTEPHALLRTLYPGNMFGVSRLFADEVEAVSQIRAMTACTVFYLSEPVFSALLETDPVLLHRYIRFLTGRIRFLNRRIACFTAGSAERRLALYLDSLCEEAAGDCVTLDVPLGTLASLLALGRASLYRAMDRLEQDGFLHRDGKRFSLFRRPEMLSHYL